MSLFINVEQILKLDQWITEGKTPEEKERRLKQTQELIFPSSLTAEERRMREQLVEEAKFQQKAQVPAEPTAESVLKDDEDEGDEGEGADDGEEEEIPWAGLVPRTSNIFKWTAEHDSTFDEVKRMNSLARGSPFKADEDFREKPVVPAANVYKEMREAKEREEAKKKRLAEKR